MNMSYAHIVFWSAICSTAGFLLWKYGMRYRAYRRAERVFPAKHVEWSLDILYLLTTTTCDTPQACADLDYRRRRAVVGIGALIWDLRRDKPPDLPAGTVDRLADIGRRLDQLVLVPRQTDIGATCDRQPVS